MKLAQRLLESLPELDEGQVESVYRSLETGPMSIDVFRSNLSSDEVTQDELNDLRLMQERVNAWLDEDEDNRQEFEAENARGQGTWDEVASRGTGHLNTESVPLECACHVVAHVVDGRVVKITAEISELAVSEDLEYYTPAPSDEAIAVVMAALENGEAPEVSLDS